MKAFELMKTEHDKIEELLNHALNLQPDQRATFLDGACRNDQELRKKVETLLQAHEEAKGFLTETPTVLGAPLSEGPGTRIGRYKLLQQIGEGGMGVVYMAEQEEPVRRRVALKIIKLGMDTRQVVARFEAERQALALMDHPNIAKVLDGGATETGRPYFVMELVQGVPITDFCDKAKLSSKERLKLFIQICQAVQHAHQKGIIHRDIKPSNVLVTLHDGVPVPKVIDFGIAKATNQKLTEKTLFTNFASMIGTPAYMSPEQAEMSGLDIDTRTDIYALGVLLYALLTGTTPFPEKRLRSLGYGEMQRVIMEEEPERPSTRLSTMANEQKTIVARNCGEELSSLSNLLKGDLDWIVMKCLEKDRQRRYETANGLASDIQRHLSNEPVIARPPSQIYRLQKAFRRNKVVFVAAAAVVLALLVGLSLAAIGWQQAKAERDSAITAREAANDARGREKAQRDQAEANAQRAADNETKSRRNLYAAEMNLAANAIADGNVTSARQRLLPWSTNESEDLREFTWRYLWKQAQGDDSVTVRVSRDALALARFSPDERTIAIQDAANTLTFWDTASLKLMRTITNVLGPGGWSVDGTSYLVGHTNGDIGFVNPKSGAFRLLFNHPHAFVHLVANGRRLTTSADFNSSLEHFDLGQETSIPIPVSLANVHATLGTNWELRFISGDGRLGMLFPTKVDDNIKSVDIFIWDSVQQRTIKKFSRTKPFTAVVWSRDGRLFAIGEVGTSAVIDIWNVETEDAPVHLAGHTGSVRNFSFSRDDKWLVSGSSDHTIRVWNVQTGHLERTLRGHEGPINSVKFFDHDQRVLSAGVDGTFRIWPWQDRTTPNRLEGLAHGRTSHGRTLLRPVVFSHDGRWLAGVTNQVACVWESETLLPVFRVPDSRAVLEFGSNDRSLYVRHLGRVAKWDLSSDPPREVEQMALEAVKDDEVSVTISPDGRHVALMRPTLNELEVVEFPTGRKSFSYKGGAVNLKPPGDARFSADGNSLFASETDGANGWLNQWDMSGRRVQKCFMESAVVAGLALSPDGRVIAISSPGSNTVNLFDEQSGTQVATLRGHRQQAWGQAFSADGRTLASASTEGIIRLWSLTTFQELATIPFAEKDDSSKPDSRVFSAVFSPDNNTLAAVSLGSGTLRLFHAAPQAAIDAGSTEGTR